MQANEKETQIVPKRYLSLFECSEYLQITKVGVLSAIKLNKLKAGKVNGKWAIDQDEADDYKKRKYNRNYSYWDGKPLFDPKKGTYTIKIASETFGIKTQSLYYAIREREIPYERKGQAYILKEKDIMKYLHKRCLNPRGFRDG